MIGLKEECIKIGGHKVSVKSLDRGLLDKIRACDSGSGNDDIGCACSRVNIKPKKVSGGSSWHLKVLKKCGKIGGIKSQGCSAKKL